MKRGMHNHEALDIQELLFFERLNFNELVHLETIGLMEFHENYAKYYMYRHGAVVLEKFHQ